MAKRRIFISFDHEDTTQVSGFMGLRQILDGFDFYNHKLDRRIQSSDVDYVTRVIRDDYIKPAPSIIPTLWRAARSFLEP